MKMYCANPAVYSRRKTTTVNIGDLSMGSDFPIRIQSMTTTDTMDTAGSVAQIKRMVDAGCELVRLTAPSINEAKNLENIKKALLADGIRVPLVADIHFTPNAAEMAARIVEKVRINPGNYADRKKFETLEYTDAEYQEEIDRIREKFVPLIKICKEYGTALRIGTNHGSLSDRIMSRYGDTPLGMVESAMEFLRIAREENFHQIVLSMKSSNPQVMVHAYRLLVQTMDANNMHYPLHLGVTEAGDGDDGRIKSALGIGTLLEDGIGDTVRVSLTEDPEFEVPVARNLVKSYSLPERISHPELKPRVAESAQWDPYSYKKRETKLVGIIGGNQVPRVLLSFTETDDLEPHHLAPAGYTYDPVNDKWNMSDTGADFIVLKKTAPFMLPVGLQAIYPYSVWKELANKQNSSPLIPASELGNCKGVFSSTQNFISFNCNELSSEVLEGIGQVPNAILVIHSSNPACMPELRNAFFLLQQSNQKVPVIIHLKPTSNLENLMLESARDAGALLIDGFGDGIWIDGPQDLNARINQISFGILQAARTRISKTEYISCPSCGRTLFDLQETTARIRKVTDHLKGVKIAIMGCIVNGPGEMADADYGYVGSGPGKITLYKGKEVVKKGVNTELAVQELINLIKDNGDWTEPVQVHATTD
ncbi:MAG: (E)-4-hydroxy-3-methylbut-2-enyl-diphosphate synthase [Bacteroidetes bacterium]|nr:(E)-4-hydroxy-3-methylbut-2-enyl-diphosphate synthase [Bacteroidota bacterium]